MAKTLLERIRAETGLVVDRPEDKYILAGMFNRYRPSGAGVERILQTDGVEGAVRARVLRIFAATAAAAKPGDLYFVVRQPEPIDPPSAVQLATAYLSGIVRLAEFANDSATCDAVAALAVSPRPNTVFIRDERIAGLIWECVGNFLSRFQVDRHALFLLKEAFYSMANDLILTGYLLWPAVQKSVPLPDVLAPYFDLWSHGCVIEYSTDGDAYIRY